MTSVWGSRRTNRAEAKLKSIFSAHEKRESRQKPFRKFFGGGAKLSLKISTKIREGYSEPNGDDAIQFQDACLHQRYFLGQSEPLGLVTPSSPAWPTEDVS